MAITFALSSGSISSPVLDPLLELIGDPAPGAALVLRVEAQPGDSVRLMVGSPVVADVGGVLEVLTTQDRATGPRVADANGLVDFEFAVPSSGDMIGFLAHTQAEVSRTGDPQVHRTNAVPILVR